MIELSQETQNPPATSPVDRAFEAFQAKKGALDARDVENFTLDQLEELSGKIAPNSNDRLKHDPSKDVLRRRAIRAATEQQQDLSDTVKYPKLQQVLEPNLARDMQETAAPYLEAGLQSVAKAADTGIAMNIPVVSTILYSLRHAFFGNGVDKSGMRKTAERIWNFGRRMAYESLVHLPFGWGESFKEELAVMKIDEALGKALVVQRKRYVIDFRKEHLEHAVATLPAEQKNPATIVAKLNAYIASRVKQDSNAGKPDKPIVFSIDDLLKPELTSAEHEAQKKKEDEEKLKVTQEKVRSLWGNGYDVRFGGDKRVYAEKNGDKWMVTVPVAAHKDAAGSVLTTQELMLQKALVLPAQEIEIESNRKAWELNRIGEGRVKVALPLDAQNLLQAIPSVISEFAKQTRVHRLSFDQESVLPIDTPKLKFMTKDMMSTLKWNEKVTPDSLVTFLQDREKEGMLNTATTDTIWEYKNGAWKNLSLKK